MLITNNYILFSFDDECIETKSADIKTAHYKAKIKINLDRPSGILFLGDNHIQFKLCRYWMFIWARIYQASKNYSQEHC